VSESVSVIQSFVHQVVRPETPDGSALVLLHGTGGTEHDLFPLGLRVAPHSILIGVRGRSLTEGSPRWFRRLTMVQFDQENIQSEAEAFAAFLPELLALHQLQLERTTLLGYSNGANFIAAVMLLYPHLIRRAILLRPMLVLDDPPKGDLSNAKVLLISGERDPYARYVPPLEEALQAGGAQVTQRVIDAGHELAKSDLRISQEWLNEVQSLGHANSHMTGEK
jgi:phospholipase/carboxylesterase